MSNSIHSLHYPVETHRESFSSILRYVLIADKTRHHPCYAINHSTFHNSSRRTAPSHKPKLFLTFCRTIFSYSSLLFLHIFAASIFAGLSSFGSASMLMTLIRIFSTLWIGDQRSDACSYWSGSSPGGCRIDIQTSPLLYTGFVSTLLQGLTGYKANIYTIRMPHICQKLHLGRRKRVVFGKL